MNINCNGLDVTIKNLPDGSIGIRPHGYGDFSSAAGYGWPIVLERHGGRLRLIVFSDINSDDPTILDMEGARE